MFFLFFSYVLTCAGTPQVARTRGCEHQHALPPALQEVGGADGHPGPGEGDARPVQSPNADARDFC